MRFIPLWRYLLVGIGGGTLAGLMGVGGGVVLIPLMTAYLGLSQREAHATSLAVIVPTALVAAIYYAQYPRLEDPGNPVPAYIAVAGFVVSSILAAPLGARIAHHLNPAQLRRIFAVLLTAVAIRMILQDPTVGNIILLSGLVLMVAMAVWSLARGKEQPA